MSESEVTETEVETTTEETSDEVETEEQTGPQRDPMLAAGDTPEFKWYIMKTLSNFEHKVCKALRERIINHKMTESFSDIMVPEETVTTHANGKKRTIKKKIFPGYVLVKMIMNDSTWHLVQDTDKVTGFVGGTKNKPAPISEEEAAYMTQQVQEGFKSKGTMNFVEGDSVKVLEGPFKTFVGVIESVSDKGKLKVQISIFGRQTPVELDFTQVEKAN